MMAREPFACGFAKYPSAEFSDAKRANAHIQQRLCRILCCEACLAGLPVFISARLSLAKYTMAKRKLTVRITTISVSLNLTIF